MAAKLLASCEKAKHNTRKPRKLFLIEDQGPTDHI